MSRGDAQAFRPEILQRLLPALAVIMAPQLPRLPLWLITVTAGFGAWCYFINERRVFVPGVVLRTLLSLLLPLAVLGHYGTLLGRDAGIALLVAMLALKLIEIHAPRDVYVVVFLGYFLIGVSFVYAQSPAMALYMLIGVTMLTAILIDLNRGHGAPVGENLRFAGALLLRALPLALVLFVLFPRLTGPLWGLPRDAYGVISGLNDEMTPGEISDLSQSDEIAFRVSFDGDFPPPRQRYWRGPVLWDTDGSRWRAGERESVGSDEAPLVKSGAAVIYTITLEPTNQRWLFALDLVDKAPAGAKLGGDFMLINDRPLRERLHYTLTSYPRGVAAKLSAAQRTRALRLPADGNPRARALAQQWRSRDDDPAAIVQQALNLFHDQPFVYTLHPSLISDDFVDGFLFNTRRGFCEHYAASFAFLMRAAGIPARVVTGYQGGELNPVGHYLIVRQRDAHAWTEVWLNARGWVRIDPTAAVAPQRIERGIESVMQPMEDVAGFDLAADGWLPSLWRQTRYGLDALNNTWNQWVLRYNAERQALLLQHLQWGALPGQAAAILLAIALGAALLGLVLRLFQRQRQRTDPVLSAYRRFCAKMARRGLSRLSHEGPGAFAARAAAHRPDLAPAIQTITRLYIALRYGPRQSTPALNQLLRAVRRFQP